MSRQLRGWRINATLPRAICARAATRQTGLRHLTCLRCDCQRSRTAGPGRRQHHAAGPVPSQQATLPCVWSPDQLQAPSFGSVPIDLGNGQSVDIIQVRVTPRR